MAMGIYNQQITSLTTHIVYKIKFLQCVITVEFSEWIIIEKITYYIYVTMNYACLLQNL